MELAQISQMQGQETIKLSVSNRLNNACNSNKHKGNNSLIKDKIIKPNASSNNKPSVNNNYSKGSKING
ncbi:hypothetical protein DIU36_14480 [Mucilaginibacter rubeus]|nr:hypothetical protein DIU36_14480 [Mucilaginibacter rubeus]